MVPHEEQLERIRRYLDALGQLHPLLSKWYLQGASVQNALSNEVLGEPLTLSNAAVASLDAEYPTWLPVSAWNGQENPQQGGLTFSYDAHDIETISSMDFEDAGALVSALENSRPVLVEMLRRAVSIWPEIDWGWSLPPGTTWMVKPSPTDKPSAGSAFAHTR